MRNTLFFASFWTKQLCTKLFSVSYRFAKMVCLQYDDVDHNSAPSGDSIC